MAQHHTLYLTGNDCMIITQHCKPTLPSRRLADTLKAICRLGLDAPRYDTVVSVGVTDNTLSQLTNMLDKAVKTCVETDVVRINRALSAIEAAYNT